MRITRIYQPISLKPDAIITLDTAASNHLLKVLRFNVGDHFRLFNGEGGEYDATLSAIEKKLAVVKVNQYYDVQRESPLVVHLAQGIARGEKMDYVLQKAVELGIKKITPLFTDHGNVKLSGERLTQKLSHWQGVINHACEQSGRDKVPHLSEAVPFDRWTSHKEDELKLILHPQAEYSLNDFQAMPKSVCVAIGAEGGFSDNELMLAEKQGFQKVSLGPRILRTETAGLAVITALQLKWGDLG